jgi:hypothetical protein
MKTARSGWFSRGLSLFRRQRRPVAPPAAAKPADTEASVSRGVA